MASGTAFKPGGTPTGKVTMKALILIVATLPLAAQSGSADACTPKPAQYAPALPARLMEGMGTISFPITTRNPEAQKFFDQGVAQMHSFWAVEAERSFRQASALDPEAPMPHWGIAMVAAGDFRPRFQLQDSDNVTKPNPRAVDAARRAQELGAGATDRERLYIDSIVARRMKGDGAFVESLRVVVAKHPDEIEARTYLALMLMKGFTLPDHKPRTAESMEAAAMLRQLMKDAPDHPGVHHYVIHGFEGSTFAKDAWHSCERYAALVPNIPHALHMPGHIYSQTARWDAAVTSFEAAAVSERQYMAADSLYGSSHHAHNVHYLSTSYSFGGNYDKAVAAAQELLAIPENPREKADAATIRTAQYQGFFALMRTMVQFRKWEEVLRDLPRPTRPRAVSWYHWARGVANANLGRTDAAKEEAKLFRASLTGNVHPSLPVAEMELDAHLALTRGDWKRARTLFEKASGKERELRYTEPPSYPRPVAEAWASEARKHGDEEMAGRAWKIALEQYPGNAHAEAGLRGL